MEIEFNNYFNKILREYLKYQETFVITLSNNRIILVPSVNSGLLNLIKTDVTLKTNLINQLRVVLNKYYPNQITDTYLSSHGSDIVINYSLKPKRVEILFTELYSVIFSYSTLEDIKTFEETKEFSHIVNDPKFWINLVNNRFSGYLRILGVVNDYKKFYYDMFGLDKIINSSHPRYPNKLLISLSVDYPKLMAHLIKNEQFQIGGTGRLEQILFILDDPELVDYIYDNTDNDIDYQDIYEDAFRHGTLGPRIFEYLFEKSGHSYNFDDLSEALFLASEADNEKLIKHIISRVPENIPKDDLYKFFSDVADGGINKMALDPLWNKYKHLFTPREIKDLNEGTVNQYYETGDDDLLNYFGEPKFPIDEDDE